MVDINAAIKQAVYDYLTEHSSPVAELFEARISGMVNRALDGQNQRIKQLETHIAAWAQQVESTRSRVRELAEQLDQQREKFGLAMAGLDLDACGQILQRLAVLESESSNDAIVDATINRLRAVVITRIAEEFESHNFARRVEEVLKNDIDVADYIDWEYVSRNEIDVETLAERMDFAQMMRETVEELEFKVTVR